MKSSKKNLIVTLGAILMVVTIGITYAFISQTLTGNKKVTITAGTLSLVLNEENSITISDALPMYDQVGMMQNKVFTFSIINNTSNVTNYVLKLSKIESDNELQLTDVKYYLTKEGVGEPKLLSTLDSDGTVDSGTIAGNDSIDYTLRLWIRDGVTDNETISGKSLSYRLIIDASMATEYKVTFDTNDGNPTTTNIYTEGETYKELPIPTKEGFRFVGWYTEEGVLVTNDSIVSKVTNDTLYAKWQIIAGLYDADNNLLVTWEDSGIDISIDYTSESGDSTDYDLATTSGYYVIKNYYPTATKLIIPSSVKEIGNYAFVLSSLKEVILEDGVESIGFGSFGYTSLDSVTIPSSVTYIGGNAFGSVNNINYTGSETEWNNIEFGKVYGAGEWFDYNINYTNINYNYTE